MLVMVIFAILAILILTAAVLAVSARNIIHAALWLITSFFGVGALYLLLEAEFLAVTQVLIYVGAVSILILFAIMLTRQVTGESSEQFHPRWWLSLLVSALLFATVIMPTVYSTVSWQTAPAVTVPPTPIASANEIGVAFLRQFLLPFELASVLLLVALIGAILIAFEERSRRRKVLTLAEEFELRRRAQREREAALEPAVVASSAGGDQPLSVGAEPESEQREGV